MAKKTYLVESNFANEWDKTPWIACMREDLYTESIRECPECGHFTRATPLETEAVFPTVEAAETFITAMIDLIHTGADRQRFRIVDQ
jgi:hypothetical protein